MKLIVIVSVLLFPTVSAAERDVPTELFGIQLGARYDLGDPENGDLGNLPVRQFIGVERFLGSGIHYYFQPLRDYEWFEYIEQGTDAENAKQGDADERLRSLGRPLGDNMPKASFRVYLLPVIPDRIKTLVELKSEKTLWEVMMIAWQHHAETPSEAYWWVRDLCKTFGADISVEPKVIDDYEWDQYEYECSFISGTREFKVENIHVLKTVRLSYLEEVGEKMDEAVERKIRQLLAKEIRPY